MQKEYESVKAKAIARFAADQEAAQQALQDAHWEATEAADAARGGLNLPLKELLAALDSRWQQLETIHRDAVELMQRRGHWSDLPELPPVGVILEKQPGRRFCHALEQSQAQFRVLSKQLLPRFFQGLRPWDSSSCYGSWPPAPCWPCSKSLSGGIGGTGRPPPAEWP